MKIVSLDNTSGKHLDNIWRTKACLRDGLTGESGCRIRQQMRASLGLGSGDRFRALRGSSGCFTGRVERTGKRAVLQGKRATKRLSEIT
jgi:hypothetical protein